MNFRKLKKAIVRSLTTKTFSIPLWMILVFPAFVIFFLIIWSNNLQNHRIDNTKLYTNPNDLNTATSSVKINPKAMVKPTPATSLHINYGRSVRVPILTYHYIGNNPNPKDKMRDYLSVSTNKLDEQMNYLAKNGYSPIILDTLYAELKGVGALPSKPIVLTFDDGYIDFYFNAYPILKKYNFHAVAFIPTGLMNQGYYLSWNQIKEMDKSGLVSFQAHSVNHSNLTTLTPDQINYQIVESKKTLEKTLGKPVNSFAYPYGDTNNSIEQMVKNAGFIGSVGTWNGLIESEGTIYNMPRIKIAGDLSLSEFSLKL